MSKDFDDFEGLTEDEYLEITKRVADAMELESSDGITSVPIEKAYIYNGAITQAVILKTLRKYHEWANS